MSDGDGSLSLEGISKRFGALEALVDASLHVRPGSVHALLGENGAGKTTLMRVAYGLVTPDRGEIRVGGQRVGFSSPKDAIRHGIGMVQQHFALVDAMTIAENTALGGHGRYDARATAERVRALSRDIGVSLDPAARAGALGVTGQQQVEIIKALARNARILILDEPTAVLSPADAGRLLAQMRALANAGLAIVLITHKLREALSVADDVTVLRHGRRVLTAPVGTLDETMVTSEMLGSGWTLDAPMDRVQPAPPAGAPVLSAHHIDVRDERGARRVHGVSLEVRAGEIVGVAGAEGSGTHELLRGLLGLLPITAGSIDRPARTGFIPADRHREAIAAGLSVVHNVALHQAGGRRGLMPWATIREHTRQLVAEYEIRVPGIDAPVETLSGGNQQKLVLAREVADRPELLVAENPTRGLDVRSAAGVRGRLVRARDDGMAIVLHSSDLDELIALADRTYGMFAGRLIPTEPTREALGQSMLGLVSA